MPSAQITSYTVHVGRLGELGHDRLIVLHHLLLREGSPVQGASEVYFSPRFADSTIGFSTMGSPDAVRAHLPADDFGAWLDLLRHEAPVYVHWSVAEVAGTPESDGIIHLSTGPEPPGEGPVDLSP